MEIVIGIDLGTQGVRILAVTPTGEIVATAHEILTMGTNQLPAGWTEQDPHSWWNATAASLRHLASSLPAGTHVAGIAVDSTSGTVLPIDRHGEPLHAALMYNDARSEPYVSRVRRAGTDLENRLGYAFNASFALPKILWLMHECPELNAQTHMYVHASDFITGRLTGDYGVTDYSNALKTGYDLMADEWPSFIELELGLPLEHLPRVVAPGSLIGNLNQYAAHETDLPAGTPVYGGATDGTAAQIASGAVEPGAWNSSLGTTLVIKGITKQLLRDPQHRIYSHRHPAGGWMPGGASNTGCEWIMREYSGQDVRQLDAEAATLLPTRLIRYPLARTGERFPFLRPQARGFVVGQAVSLPMASPSTKRQAGSVPTSTGADQGTGKLTACPTSPTGADQGMGKLTACPTSPTGADQGMGKLTACPTSPAGADQGMGKLTACPTSLSAEGGQANSLPYYAAGLEGTALLERLAYDTLREIGATIGERIHVTGGGSTSNVWLRVRATTLGCQLVRPVTSETAMGSALLAATGAWFEDLGAAARAMVRLDVTVDPDPGWRDAYAEKYSMFCAELRARGYI